MTGPCFENQPIQALANIKRCDLQRRQRTHESLLQRQTNYLAAPQRGPARGNAKSDHQSVRIARRPKKLNADSASKSSATYTSLNAGVNSHVKPISRAANPGWRGLFG